ncbi:MAG: Wzz/FepE/Etk N-terminal domain-containing protein, partial [Steroidobacteraceae bacterium]|nr:Wzz/FepE/Etk N-terminal domain-containing protein [Steroidobacteraceae bacterium]
MTHDTNELAPGSPAEKGMEPLGRLVYVVPAEQLNAELGDELNLARFACVLWRNRVRFLLIVFAFAFTALVYVLSATEWYRSEVVLAPNSE